MVNVVVPRVEPVDPGDVASVDHGAGDTLPSASISYLKSVHDSNMSHFCKSIKKNYAILRIRLNDYVGPTNSQTKQTIGSASLFI